MGKKESILRKTLLLGKFSFFGSHFDSLSFFRLLFGFLRYTNSSGASRLNTLSLSLLMSLWWRFDYWTHLRRNKDSEKMQMKPSIIGCFPTNSHAHTHKYKHTHEHTQSTAENKSKNIPLSISVFDPLARLYITSIHYLYHCVYSKQVFILVSYNVFK